MASNLILEADVPCPSGGLRRSSILITRHVRGPSGCLLDLDPLDRRLVKSRRESEGPGFDVKGKATHNLNLGPRHATQMMQHPASDRRVDIDARHR